MAVFSVSNLWNFLHCLTAARNYQMPALFSHTSILCSVILCVLFVAGFSAQESQSKSETGNATVVQFSTTISSTTETPKTTTTAKPESAQKAEPIEKLTAGAEESVKASNVDKVEPVANKISETRDETGDVVGAGAMDFDIPLNSHFIVYLLVFGCLMVALYVLFHNRKKVLGLIVEGRRRREPRRAGYRRVASDATETSSNL